MDGDVVILQDARHGDLGSWLERLAGRNKGKPLSERERPPEAVLWSIFYCLFHACLAMAYPQRLAGRGPGGAKAPVPARPETIPRGASRDSKPTDALVHFDLRPSNGMFTCGLKAAYASSLNHLDALCTDDTCCSKW